MQNYPKKNTRLTIWYDVEQTNVRTDAPVEHKWSVEHSYKQIKHWKHGGYVKSMDKETRCKTEGSVNKYERKQ